MTTADVMPRLARDVLNALELELIHFGRLAEATSSANSSGRGAVQRGWRWSILSGRVEYTAGTAEGSVKVRDVVAYAADHLTVEAGQRIVDAYKLYCDTWRDANPMWRCQRPPTDRSVFAVADEAHRNASRALTRATRTAFDPPVVVIGDQYALFATGLVAA